MRLEKPKGEAGDSKRGFNLQDAMGLGDDEVEFRAIQVSALFRSGALVVLIHFLLAALRPQECRSHQPGCHPSLSSPGSGQAGCRLQAGKSWRSSVCDVDLADCGFQTRKDHPWVTERRFALNWAVAEMVKQYLRNKRRYGVRVGYIPDRETRKRQREEDTQQENSNGKRRHTGTAGGVRHIDDEESDEDIPGGEDPSRMSFTTSCFPTHLLHSQPCRWLAIDASCIRNVGT